ncbi:response regulator transcription factor [Adlercreutzia sp. ZJ473]|uniref:response regulator n=1 Tax=Adlercreutzia sp. ZJ473 TaxID=2722822 RepID=UPI001553DED5
MDNHSLYREGLVALFEKWDDFDVIGEATDGAEAIEFCRHWPPDVVLMDLKMPCVDGIEATRVICAENPGIAVIILSVHAEEQSVIASIRNGARGYLLKNTHAKRLHSHLRNVVKGASALSDEVSAICLEYIRHIPREHAHAFPRPEPDNLTDHEKQLIRLLAMGYSNRDIGERLFIGEGTVKKQVSSMLAKLGLENRVQAAVYALRSGIAE